MSVNVIGFAREDGERFGSLEEWAEGHCVEPDVESLERFFVANLWEQTKRQPQTWPGERATVGVAEKAPHQFSEVLQNLIRRGMIFLYGSEGGVDHYALTDRGTATCSDYDVVLLRYMQAWNISLDVARHEREKGEAEGGQETSRPPSTKR